MELVAPSEKYKESFLEALVEYQKEETTTTLDLLTLNKKDLENDFSTYLRQLADATRGKNLPKGFIAHTTYWLVDGNTFIGRVDIRHKLTEHLRREGGHIGYDIRPTERNKGYGKKILALALLEAKTLGIVKVLVTCDETNFSSKKIIESNGGVFEDSVAMGIGKPKKLRYWVDLS